MSRTDPKSATGCDNIPDARAASVETRSRAELVGEWERLYRCSPPPRLSTRLLRLGVAYLEQAKIHGGLKIKTRKRLQLLPRSVASEPVPEGAKRRIASSTGTRLVREWRGQTHVVDVLEHGVLYEGRTYRSLSEVARAITGARWSGPRFFGL